MHHDIVLYVTQAGLSPCNKHPLLPHAVHPASPDGLNSFEAWLRSQRSGVVLTMLIDLPDESHHRESLPFTRGRDRAALLERRRTRAIGDTPYAATLSLGRSPEGRRDEKILFAAQAHAESITPWLERIQTAGCLLRGIHSTSFLAFHLLSDTQRKHKQIVLALVTPAGFRVCCFVDGHLAFSRLTPNSASGTNWRDELRRSADYLVSQRLLPRDSTTPLILFDAPCLHITPEAPLDQLHPALSLQVSKAPGDAPGADTLPSLLTALTQRPRQPQFANRAMLGALRRRRVEWAIHGLSACIVTLLAGLSLHNMTERAAFSQQTHELEQLVLRNESRLRNLEANHKPLPRSPTQLERELAYLDRLQAPPTRPDEDFQALARILDRLPALHIQTMEWQRPLPQSTAGDGSRSLRIELSATPEVGQDSGPQRQIRTLIDALTRWPNVQVSLETPPDRLRRPEDAGGDPPWLSKPDRPAAILIRWSPP